MICVGFQECENWKCEYVKISDVESEPQGTEIFGRSPSRYSEVSAPALGKAKVVRKNHNSYWIG